MKYYSYLIPVLGVIVGFGGIGDWVTPTNAQVLEVKAKNVGLQWEEFSVKTKNSPKKISSKPPLRLPVYKPPKGIGAPGGRVGGGTRGDDSAMLMLFALVPDHLGLTIKEQPTLYWYLSNQSSHRLVLTINHEDLVKPVLEMALAESGTPGIHSVSLSDHNIKLELHTEYKWFVELVMDVDYPARNLVAGGRIKRIPPPEPLLIKLREAEVQERTSIYSEAGLWYDAFDSISDLIDRKPDNPDYPIKRKYLLKQIYEEEIDDMMAVAKEEESVSLQGDYMNLYKNTIDESYVRALVDHSH
ncbi:MAG: DUF928 domain-containing protein [Nitrospirales bacterium]